MIDQTRPIMAEGRVNIGDESGKLGETMNEISASSERQLDEATRRMIS
jgi:type II secretory pathway component PulF